MPSGIYKRTLEMKTGKWIRMEGNKNALGYKWTKDQIKNKSEATKKLWRIPEYRAKLLPKFLEGARKRGNRFSKGNDLWRKSISHKKPNKTEIFLNNFLNKIFPNEYKFVGDGNFIINNKCPDFVNRKKNKLIELFGDYWHGEEKTGKTKEEVENEKINHFKQYGLDTLIIWERELNNLKKLKKKISIFNNK